MYFELSEMGVCGSQSRLEVDSECSFRMRISLGVLLWGWLLRMLLLSVVLIDPVLCHKMQGICLTL